MKARSVKRQTRGGARANCAPMSRRYKPFVVEGNEAKQPIGTAKPVSCGVFAPAAGQPFAPQSCVRQACPSGHAGRCRFGASASDPAPHLSVAQKLGNVAGPVSAAVANAAKSGKSQTERDRVGDGERDEPCGRSGGTWRQCKVEASARPPAGCDEAAARRSGRGRIRRPAGSARIKDLTTSAHATGSKPRARFLSPMRNMMRC